MKAAILIPLLLTVGLLPGCLAPASTGLAASTSPVSPTSSSAQATPHSTSAAPPTATSTAAPTSAAPHVNHPPTAAVDASVINGSAPLLVNFTLTASDPDGDNLTYTFSPDNTTDHQQHGNGSFPVSTNFTYTAPGVFNATLTVTDGTNSTTATTAVTVVAGSAGGAAAIVLKGHAYVPDPAATGGEGECLFPIIAGSAVSQFQGISGNEFQLPAGVDGKPFAVKPGTGFQVKWVDKDFNYVGTTATSGTVPAGAVTVDVCSVGAVNTDYTLTITG